MKKEDVKQNEKMVESFPGQPEDKDIFTDVSVPFKQANKEHDENTKNAEEAMTANQEAVDLVYGDNTKKKDGKFKNNELKKMHLSENLFSDNFNEDYNPDSITPYKDMLYDEVENGNEGIILDELLAYISEDDARDILNTLGFLDDIDESCKTNEACEDTDIEEEMDLDEATDNVFDKIAKKLAVSEDLKKNK